MEYVSVRSLQYHVKLYNKHQKKKVVFLHGFTGTSDTWDEVMQELPPSIAVLTIDLIGHGNSAKPTDVRRYFVEEQVEDLRAIFTHFGWEDFLLVGYSMGGRLALSYATKYPVGHLLLESSSPGIEEENERKERREADAKLASFIEKEGIHNFVDYWENIPLFISQKQLPVYKKKTIREERISQSEIGLANSLRGFSTGTQPSLWDKLDSIPCPITLVTGELDQKFCKIADRMEARLPSVKRIIVKDTGHAIHVENSKFFATIVKDIILKEEQK